MEKKFLLVWAIAALLGNTGYGQELDRSTIPSIVLNAFHAEFPSVGKEDWERDRDVYKVEFETKNVDTKMWISHSGVIIKLKQDIKAKDLPASVKSTLALHYKRFEIDDVVKITFQGKVEFEVELESSTGDRKVLISPDGNVINDRIN
jgi:hypothetical protein